MFWVDRRTADVMEGGRGEVLRQGRPEDALLGPYPTRAGAEAEAAELLRRRGVEPPGRWDPPIRQSPKVRKEELRRGHPLQFGLALLGVGTVGLVAGLALGEKVLVGFGVYALVVGTVLALVGRSLRR